VTAQPAASASDLSSRNRAPDDFIPVGDYQMPAFRGGATAAEPEKAPVAEPAAARRAPSAPAPFSRAGDGGGFGDRLGKATRGFLGNLGNGPLGALAGGLGALVTGQNTDPSSIAAEQNSMSARALLAKGASPSEVQAARYNPALMKALIDNYYGKDRWQVVQTGEDDQGRKTFMQQNQVDGTLRPIGGTPAASSSGAGDFVTGPNGEKIAIPPGVDRKAFVKRITEANADAATGKGTEAQGKAGKFTTIANDAEKVIRTVEAQGKNVWGRLSDNLPMGGAYLQSPDYQKYKAAKEAFIGAHLRDVSGAAIGTPEYIRAEKTFFPQPGEGPEVIRQKAALRANLIETMRREAGPGYKPPTTGGSAGKTSSGISWSVQ
jgi:hypothetical protein